MDSDKHLSITTLALVVSKHYSNLLLEVSSLLNVRQLLEVPSLTTVVSLFLTERTSGSIEMDTNGVSIKPLSETRMFKKSKAFLLCS